MSRRQWEYTVKSFSDIGGDAEYHRANELARLGANGWELVAVVQDRMQGFNGWFKREVTDGSVD